MKTNATSFNTLCFCKFTCRVETNICKIYKLIYNIVKFAFEQNGTTKYLGYPLSSLESFTEFSLGNNEKRFFGVQLNGNISRYGTVSAAYLSDSKLAEGGGNP